jgi:hypothetical protein
MKTKPRCALALAGALCLFACGSSSHDPGAGVPRPPVDGKGDLVGIRAMGEIAWGGEVTGQLTGELAFHAYSFKAEAGAQFTLEVTRTGSARDLATVLYLFGPARAEGGSGPLVGQDLDSGWGAKSKLGAEVAAFGSYTAVLGQADGRSQGHYRLTLTCDRGGCAPADQPVQLSETTIPSAAADAINYDDDYSWHELWKAYEVTGALQPNIDRVAAAVAQAFVDEFADGLVEEFNRWEYRGEIGREALRSVLESEGSNGEATGVSLAEFEHATGINAGYRIAYQDYDRNCGPSVECIGYLYTLWDPQTNAVYAIDSGYASE